MHSTKQTRLPVSVFFPGLVTLMASLGVIASVFFAPCLGLAQEAQNKSAADRAALAAAEEKRLGLPTCPLVATDPEFVANRDRLFLGQIQQKGTLSDTQRMLVMVVTASALDSGRSVAMWTKSALKLGVDPVAIREAVHQVTPYIGYTRAENALIAAYKAMNEKGISLPLDAGATVNEDTRFNDGLAVQKSIFGEGIDAMHKNAPKGQEAIVIDYLSAWCFGDTYTRKGLDLKTRELLTFVAIAALGGCDPQARAHAQGNLAVGNDKQLLVDTLAQMLPSIGYPRTLNALAQVNAVAK